MQPREYRLFTECLENGLRRGYRRAYKYTDNPSEEQLLPARENFAVLLIEPSSLDWLYLAHDGHRRAQFARSGPGQNWQGTWVIP